MDKHRTGVHVEKNAFQDSGNGLVSFPHGQVITDDSKQRNGTKYDINSMDLSEYKGQITADHTDMLQAVIGKALGVAKTNNSVTISGIQFAVQENPLALLAYNMFRNGFVTDFSIETYGPWPDESDETYYNSKLVGLSMVVVGNNKSATSSNEYRELVLNSIAQAKEDGLDTSEVERFANEMKVEEPAPEPEPKPDPKPEPEPVAAPEPQATPEPAPEVHPELPKQENDMKFVTIKNSRDFAVSVSYKNAAGEIVETDLAPGASVDVSEDQEEALTKTITDAEAPKADISALLTDALNAFETRMDEKFAKAEQKAFDAKAQEPGFVMDKNGKSGVRNEDAELKAMDWRERHAKQINSAWDYLKGGSMDAAQELRKVNTFHLERLKSEGIVQNSVSLANFGNFVISPELLSEIEGVRTNYKPLIDATNWKDTLSLTMAWLERQGDINMQPVALDNSTGIDANLKPISEYTATIQTAALEELASVTPVANATTRFLAADLLGDVATGYRNDFDRKRAQLVIARLEQAIESNGNSAVYERDNSADALISLINAWKLIANTTPNGTFILSTGSYAEIMGEMIRTGANGPMSQVFTSGDQPMMLGRPYIVVSDDLLPSLNDPTTRSFVINGTTVTVTHAVYYVNLQNFTGRTSGGLMYDLSTEAAYEEAGVVKSAYQRNELVLRGSFFRGGAIKDAQQVAGILSPGVS